MLLGRGEDVTNHEGNVRFQKMVMSRKREYLAASTSEREALALEIKNDVDARQGRFLKRSEYVEGMWLPIDAKGAMKKIKQSFLYTYNTEASERDKSFYKSIAVKYPTENDVLLGRGRKTINNPGNIRFRQLISARKPEYAGTSIHTEKDKVAREIKAAVEARNGRFLERLEGLPDSWVPVDEAIIMKKIKLCFRYHHNEPEGAREPETGTACLPLGIGASNDSQLEAARKLAGLPSMPTRHQEMIANGPAALQNGHSNPIDPSRDFLALFGLATQGNESFQPGLTDRVAQVEQAEATLPSLQFNPPSGGAANRPIHSAELLPNDVLLGR